MFKYLGSLATNTDEAETEIQARIAAGSKYYHTLDHSLKKIDMYTLLHYKYIPNNKTNFDLWCRIVDPKE